MSSKSNFVQQQGFAGADTRTCDFRYPALMFQPRVIGALVAVGLLTQAPLLFLALGMLLTWNAAFPKWNPFDAVYAALIARPRGLPVPDAAPGPRRFAQGMAAAFMLAIALSLMAGATMLAWIFEALLAAALAALLFGRFCLGSFTYHLVTGNGAFAKATLPWRR